MTKRDWDKADERLPDPGRVRQAPEEFRPSRWVPPAEQEKRRIAAAEAEHVRRERVLLVQEEERLRPKAKEARRRQAKGATLTAFESYPLERWKEVRKKLGL